MYQLESAGSGSVLLVVVVYLNEFAAMAPQTPPAGWPRFSIDCELSCRTKAVQSYNMKITIINYNELQ